MAARRRLYSAVLVAVIVAGVAFVVLRTPIGHRLGMGGPVSQDVAGPVLLVPGYGGGEDALRTLAGRLRADGRDARIVSAVDGGTGDLNRQADELDKAVDSALDAGAPSVDLVGFSAGGVVVRLWVADHGGTSKARRIVTLGSPHHGTNLASAAAALVPSECPVACRQLLPTGDLLADLNRRDETPDGPRWVSIWTADDTTVTPPDTARLEGAVNLLVQDICPGTKLAHGDLPRAPVSAGLVRWALGPDVGSTPGPVDCARIRDGVEPIGR